MLRPAASSLALLMRKPDDNRWIDVVNELWLVVKLRCAVNELTLVLMVAVISITPVKTYLIRRNADLNASIATGRLTGPLLRKLSGRRTRYEPVGLVFG
jgi:hypothetical protein